ncbi:TonB-dependent receptor [soil metagenome]
MSKLFVRRTVPTLLLGLLLLPATAHGQRRPQAPQWRPQTTDTVPDYVLEGVTATVTRSETRIRDLPQRVEIITSTDLERTPADELADVLKKQAAVDVIQFPGLLAGIGIRGFRPEYSGINQRTLLLIDGRPAGATNLALLDLRNVERIEVLKGPASSLYGSSAMGGVVNVITRRTTGEPRGQLRGAYGSFETRELGGEVGGSLSERLDVDFGYNRFSRRGDYRIGSGNFFRDRLGDADALKLFADGRTEPVGEIGDGTVRENSQYGYRSGNVRLGYVLTDSLRAEVKGGLFEADQVQVPGNLFAGTSQDLRKNVRHRSSDLSLIGGPDADGPRLRVFAADEDNEYYDVWAETPFVNFADRTTTYGGQLQGVRRAGPHQIITGLDYTSATAESRSYSAAEVRAAPWNPDWSVLSRAAFAQGMFGLGERVTATLGGRLDRISLELRETPFREDVRPGKETFTTFNPSGGLQYRLNEGIRLHATAGRAFVAPTAFNKAGLAVAGAGTGVSSITVGNAELRPERAVTYDAGIALGDPRRGFDADVTYFRTTLRDRITSVFASFPEGQRPVTPAGDQVRQIQSYVNAASAEMEGIEWRLAYDLGARSGFRYSLRLFASATHILGAEERVRGATVDAAQLAGRTDFRPEQLFGALLFGDEATSEIKNVADRTLIYGIEYDNLRRFSTRLSGRYVGERLDTDFTDWANVSDIRYPAFMVLDLATSMRLGERSRLGLTVSNLTDENYYEVRGYNLPGRSLRLNLSLGL